MFYGWWKFHLHPLPQGRDKGRIRMRMADTDADEKIRMGKCGWGIKRGWENADGG